ncbi:MAG: thiamine phosphate synthase [Bacteroidales bacterium]|nr:thiamine phosphate synthase [Bacteroidales bacterium]
MKLIVISKEKVFDGEPLWINALMGEYDFTFHLRKPGLTEWETEEIILQINSNFHNRIVLHDHFPLAAKYRLKGVHLNSRNPEIHLKGEYWKHCSISRSCHSLEEIAANKDSCNYLTLSPVFDSISKAGYNAGFSYHALKDASENGIIDNKVVALGGISSSNIQSVKKLGFGGVAVLGAVWNRATLEDAIMELENLIQKMK